MSRYKARASRRDVLIGGISAILAVGTGGEANAGNFPVRIPHAFGVTTVSAPSRRIVTLGWCGEDAVLALGMNPIGMMRYGDFEGGVFPWSRTLFQSQKAVFVEPSLDFEELALLKPDLILCVYSGVSEREYRRLSTIAPTVPFRSSPWSATWEEVTEMTGLALGAREKAAQLIAKTTQLIRGLAAMEPLLSGKTFVFGSYGKGSSELGVYLPSDPRIANLMAFGLRPAPAIVELAQTRSSQWSAGLSLETVTDLNADILIMWYGDPAIRNDAEANKLFQKIPAFSRKSYIPLDKPEDFWAISAPTVLSIPYFFPRFTPRLAECARLSER